MKLLTITPQRIIGSWLQGYALDLHTQSSEFIGYDEYGRPDFDTVRTEVGAALYKLKYSKDLAQSPRLAATAAAFVKKWGCRVDVVVPIPASRLRSMQPVHLVGKTLAARLGIPFLEGAIERAKQLPELKNVVDFGERQKLLAGAHRVIPTKVKGRRILLFDDLFRSGATMDAVTKLLLGHGAAAVYALTLTRTRSSR